MGHASSVTFLARAPRLFSLLVTFDEEFGASGAVSGVGQDCEDKKPSPAVGSANFSRRKQSFLNAVARAFQFWSDDVEVSLVEVAFDVLEEAEGGLEVEDKLVDVRPEVTRIIDALTFARVAEGLARVAANDAVHEATPRRSIDCFKVTPDRRWVQPAPFNSLGQDVGGRDFVFHVTDCASVWESDAKSGVQPASAATEGDIVDGRKTFGR